MCPFGNANLSTSYYENVQGGTGQKDRILKERKKGEGRGGCRCHRLYLSIISIEKSFPVKIESLKKMYK